MRFRKGILIAASLSLGLAAGANGSDFGLPVDLNGRYMEPGNTGNAYTTNFAVASTGSDASNFGSADRVMEISNGVGATDATFTPFSDALKPPNALAVDPRGKSWQFDVDLGGTWTDNGFGYPARTGSCFIVGGKKPGVYTTGIADVVIDHPDASGFRFDNSTDIADSLIQDLTGANQFRIGVAVDASSNSTVTITTLNGTSPGTVYVLGPGANSVQFANDTYFTAGFNRSYGGADKGQATATVSNFTTDAVDDVLYTYASDPYAKTSETTSYDFGVANLTGPIVGYQAFLSTTGNETLSGGAYTSTPFPFHIQPFGTLSGGYLSLDGETMIGTTTQVSAFLATVLMLDGAAGTAALGIAADNGNPLTPTRFSDPLGSPITPTRFDSNIVVIDNTGPSVSINTPTSPVMLGNLVFTVVADDGVGSGLTLAPTILVTFSDATTVTLQTYAKIGNTFEAILPITPTTPCGATTAAATAVDDSGNSTTTAPAAFTVSNATVTLTIVLDGSDNNLPGTVTRGMQIKLGGNPSTGTNAPFYANKNVVFSDPDGAGPLRLTGTVTLTALDGVPCGKDLNAVSVKDPKHTLRKLEPLGGINDQYTATLHLRGGDCTGAFDGALGGTIGDNAIDILDYGLFASQYGSSPGANTPLGYAGGHSDFSGDGSVLTNDYTFISTGFLLIGDNEPGNFSDGGGNQPLKTCTVQQMIERGGVPAKVAKSYDLNHDGRITYQEITNWLAGKRG